MSTPTVPGVDSDALAEAIIKQGLPLSEWGALRAADVAIAHIAAHHECACDREHDDEWVEVDSLGAVLYEARVRQEWVRGDMVNPHRYFVHRDDLADPRALIARHLGTEQANTFLSWLDKNGWTVTRKGER